MFDKPTLQDCRLWRDELVAEWGDLDDQMQTEEDLYHQRFDVEPIDEDGRLVVKTGSAPSDADAAIDSIVPTEIQIDVQPLRNRGKYEKQAEMLSKFGRALFHRWRRGKDPLRTIASDMTIRRLGVARVLVDDMIWPTHPSDWDDLDDDQRDDWEAEYRRGCPLVFERRNPRFVRWRELEDGRVVAVVEHYTTTALEASIAYAAYDGVDRILKGRRPNDKVWVDDVWLGAHRCLLLEDQPIFPVAIGGPRYKGVSPHPYNEPPYIIAPFRELGFDDVAERYRGMLTNAASLYPMESQVLTMHIGILAWNAWRPYIGWTTDGREIVMRPGVMTPIRKHMNEYLELLQGQPVPPELLGTAGVMDGYIQRNGVAQGPRTQEGTRSAQQVWAIQSIRQLKVEAAKQSLINLCTRALYLAAKFTETVVRDQITLPVPGKDREGKFVGEVTAKPGEINRYWDGFEVSFGKRLDPAVLEQAKVLSGLAGNMWMPYVESVRLSGLTDSPQLWEDMLIRQGMDRLPEIVEVGALMEAEAKYGQDSYQFQILHQKFLAQRQGGGRPVGPAAAGGGTMQLTGGPTGPAALGGGQPTPQSMTSKPVGGNTNGAAPRGVPAGTPPGGV